MKKILFILFIGLSLGSCDKPTVVKSDIPIEVVSLKEAQKLARINGGKLISDRNTYVEGLLSAENSVKLAKKALENHNKKIDFLRGEMKALDEQVEG